MKTDLSPSEQNFYARTPIVARPPLKWSIGARVAVAIVVSVEYYELQPPVDAVVPANLPGGFGRGPYPDFRVFTQREYGNRVGVFRILKALRDRGIPATFAVDAFVAANYRPLVRRLQDTGIEIAGHGIALTQTISNAMNESAEDAYIAESIGAVETAFGIRPQGWHGPEYGESERTPHLLARHGIDYVLDWPNDEQPNMMTTDHGSIVSLPMAVDCDDVVAQWHRKLTVARWQRAVCDAVDQLAVDGIDSGRLFVLNLHPWLTGQPFRIGFLEELLDHIRSREGIWLATAGEIATQYRALQSGSEPA